MRPRQDTETDPRRESELASDSPSIPPDDLLEGGYRVERALGRGGMARVLAAVDVRLGRPVAIKILEPAASQRPGVRDRFLREARALAALHDNDHVVRVLRCAETRSGLPYIVMELLEGRDLAAEIRESGPLSPADAVRFALQVCDALADAHSKGIVHRDLKPSNLLLTYDQDGKPLVKVLDFGIAKVAPAEETELNTVSGAFLGTLAFAAPEQVESTKDVDERSDVWSLGATLYLMLTDRLPFSGETREAMAASIHRTAPLPPSRLRPDLPPGLDAVILDCLVKDPERRIPDVAVLARALLPFATPDLERLVARIERRLAAAPGVSRGGATSREVAAATRGRDSDLPSFVPDTASLAAGRADRPRPRSWLSGLVVGIAITVLAAVGVRELTADRSAAPTVVFFPGPLVPPSSPTAVLASPEATTSVATTSVATPSVAPSSAAAAVSALGTSPRPRPSSRPAAEPRPARPTEEPTYPNYHLDSEPGSP